ncbi:MAG: hypothetical protein U0003_05680 [Vampirovibrionales bacterium]
MICAKTWSPIFGALTVPQAWETSFLKALTTQELKPDAVEITVVSEPLENGLSTVSIGNHRPENSLRFRVANSQLGLYIHYIVELAKKQCTNTLSEDEKMLNNRIIYCH